MTTPAIVNDPDKDPTELDRVRTMFVEELRTFLKKWNCELEAKDHYEGYAECGEDVRMTAYFTAKDGLGDVWSMHVNLGSYFTGDLK